jgi:phage anti-repressor protein
MEELIKITEQDGKRAVSARELHAFVKMDTRFDIWIKRMFEYGFSENVDYQCLIKNVQMPNGGYKSILDDYALSIDCAKEISMLQRNEKGKQARLYFIERDKELRDIEQGKLGSGRYDASRNILPGVYSPQTTMIGDQAILIIHTNDILYYRLKDILIAAGVYERKRKDTSESWFKPYVYWLNDQTGNRPKRYVTESGVLVILSKTRDTDNAKLPSFLNNFTSWTDGKRRVTGNINMKKFLDVIISIPDNDSRNFLYNLYKKLEA